MAKSKKNEPRNFQHNPNYKNKGGQENKAFFKVYESLMMSEAFSTLNSRQRMLCIYCLSQEHMGRREEKRGFPEEYRNDQRCFTMNREKRKMYRLTSNEETFNKDMEALIRHGFVNCVINGQNARKKTLYMLSSRWTTYGTDAFKIPEDVKTTAMRNRERKEGASSEARAP